MRLRSYKTESHIYVKWVELLNAQVDNFSSSDAISETRALTDWVGHCCIHDQAAQKFVQGKKKRNLIESDNQLRNYFWRFVTLDATNWSVNIN